MLIYSEEALPQFKRRVKTKIPFDESNIDDTVIRSSEERWEVDVHNVIMDSVVSSINDRFKFHKQLYKDFSCLDPRRFQEISQSSAVPDKAFDALCKKLGSHCRFSAPSTPTNGFHGFVSKYVEIAGRRIRGRF